MAVKAPRKKTIVRGSPRTKRGTKVGDFDWDGWEKWSPAKFNTQRRHATMFYYQNYKIADLVKHLHTWMKDNGYKKTDIDAVKAVATGNISTIICSLSRCLLVGMPDVHEKWNKYWVSLGGTGEKEPRPASDYIKDEIALLIPRGKLLLKEKKTEEKKEATTTAPTIQDRIIDQSIAANDEIDEWLEGFIVNSKTFDPNSFNFKSHFGKMGVTQAHARKIVAFHEAHLLEMREVASIPTPAKMKSIKDPAELDHVEQLKEGYEHIRKVDIRKIITALENLISALNMIIEESKATRKTRKPTVQSADKVVSKLKYKPKDDKYKLVSANPQTIVGATEIWVFNTKTRKIGKYVAATIDPTGQGRTGSGLSVKGTSIIGFNEDQSIQKTMRKPDEQLKEFKACGKVKLRTFMNDIKTTDTKLNGRLNVDTILLKVIA
jgi:hypothetical protein